MAVLLLLGWVGLALVLIDRPRRRPARAADGLIGRLMRLDF
ncbi:MAG: hypothetical protein WCO00_01620 [Rhodospirillaceae bacterium]